MCPECIPCAQEPPCNGQGGDSLQRQRVLACAFIEKKNERVIPVLFTSSSVNPFPPHIMAAMIFVLRASLTPL